jgi:hypothetical protein
MFKTISAAVLAAAVIAAPAFAASKTSQTSTVKTEQTPAINGAQGKTAVKTDAKVGVGTKSGALNANAKMRRHHHKYHKMGALTSKKHVAINGAVKTTPSKFRLGKTSTKTSMHVSKIHANKSHSKVSFKRTVPATKRG